MNKQKILPQPILSRSSRIKKKNELYPALGAVVKKLGYSKGDGRTGYSEE